MEIFFAEPNQISDNQITLDKFESKHILQTLKKKQGDTLFVTDGQGNLFHAKITNPAKKVSLEYHHFEKFEKARPEITLAVGFIRPNRLDILLEKCTEIGVSHFILFRSQYANYLSFNTSRMNKILRQAVKQSVQYYLPTIKIFDQFKKIIESAVEYDIKMVAKGPDSSGLISDLSNIEVNNKKHILLAIGPEGGFSEIEIDDFLTQNFIPVALGKTRLRTETAAITGASVLQSYIQYKKETNIGNR